MQLVVSSSNQKMKAHLERLVMSEFYILSPGKLSTNEASVCTLPLQPGTSEFFQALPEILGWRGYKAVYSDDVLKSLDVPDFIYLKSGDPIYNNAKGERIVKYVPENMIATNSNDGRVVVGGGYLNANIDKEGAEWSLSANPYGSMPQPERQNARSDYELGFEKYHPGMDEEAYTKRQSEDDSGEYHQLQDTYEPEDRQTLKEYFTDGSVETAKNELAQNKVSIPAHLPVALESGTLLYSPGLGIALDSGFWPPVSVSGFEYSDWYMYEYPAIEEEDYPDFIDLMGGMNPMFIRGAKSGIVKVTEIMDNDGDGVLMKLPVDLSEQDDNETIVINNPVKEEFLMEELASQEMMNKINTVKAKLDVWRDRTSVRQPDGSLGIDPTLKDVKVQGLRGMAATFKGTPYDYQNAVISAITLPDQYEVYGGPRGFYGHYLNLKYGLGKTPIICAADAVMRNTGRFKVGEQVTLITAPSKNIHVWGDEIEKFRGESAVIISGQRGDRIAQWEALLDQARNKTLPNFVIVAGSKFRLSSETYEDDDGDERKELALDAKYMKLLSLGGKSQGKAVDGSHIAALVLDETGNYVNPRSSRFSAVSEISQSVYYGNGIVWTLNGDLSGNSATDTISEISFVNMFANQNYSELSKFYTTNDPNRPHSDSKIWKNRGQLPDFMAKFKNHIYSLDGQTVAGDEYGLEYTEDLETPMGKNWGRVYTDAMEKMELTMSLGNGRSKRALGMLSLLVNSSYGAVKPQRLFEYDIGINNILKGAKELTDPAGYVELLEEVKAFWRENTEETIEVGRLPKEKSMIKDRDASWQRNLSQSSRTIIDKVVDSWDNPALDSIAKDIDDYLRSSGGKPVKIGVAGFSRRAIQILHKKLLNTYNSSKVLVLKFDGDTSSEEVGTQQAAHQNESDKHVISLVTSAGLYGLSLASDRAWVFSTWNPAKLGQYAGRWHRNAKQKNLLTVVVPSGASQYVREVSNKKQSVQNMARAEVLDLEMDDDSEEFEGSVRSAISLIDKLQYYFPRILAKESGDK